MKESRDYLAGSFLVRFARAAVSRVRTPLGRFGRRLRDWTGLSSLGASLRQAPLRTGGALLAVAALTHLTILWVLGRTLPAGGWLFRLALLGLGVMGCFNNSSWEEVRESSVLVRLLFRKGK